MKKVRCAIYTRKSSEEGLEQEFNSLHAQREACVSFIASQKHEGWVLLPNHYDDGGISGGTLERDGLKQLMRDVDDGLIDQIVVYKIDRLTRSLSDFAKLVDRLDAAEASFVSVTQSFNTATSMGRLTLNVLLSFAQFEREVTAERIRDKIAASKKKGLWMGGTIPLGYEPDGRTLKINLKEAETVRTIYDLYLKHGTVQAVVEEAARAGLRTNCKRKAKARCDPKDNDTGSLPDDRRVDQRFKQGQLHYLLTNPVYAGKIRHKDKIHEGQHEAIIDENTWAKVQVMLADGATKKRGAKSGSSVSLLAGKLFDDTGDHLTPSHANKQGRRYRYYISNRLIKKPDIKLLEGDEGTPNRPNGWRLPAEALEQQIAASIVDHLENHLATDLFNQPDVEKIEAARTKLNFMRSQSEADHKVGVLACFKKATIESGTIRIELDPTGLANELENNVESLNPDVCTFTVAFQRKKRGVETKLIIGNGSAQSKRPDQILIKNIARAHRYYEAIKQGQTFDQVAASAKLTNRRLLQVMDLAFLAPDIVKTIIIGDQPVGLTSDWLKKNPLPKDWNAQRIIVARL